MASETKLAFAAAAAGAGDAEPSRSSDEEENEEEEEEEPREIDEDEMRVRWRERLGDAGASACRAGAAVLAVVHLLAPDGPGGLDATIRVLEANIYAACSAGCAGVCIIDMRKRKVDLTNAMIPIARTRLDRHGPLSGGGAAGMQQRRRFLGINYLTICPLMTMQEELSEELLGFVDSVWVDDPTPGDLGLMRELDFKGLYMAGVAFKSSQRHLSDDMASKHAVAVKNKMHVVITSGPCTGVPPQPAKLAAMRLALGDAVPLGIASGVTPENVRDYLPYVDVILVSTGISADYHTLDPLKVRRLLEEVQSFAAQADAAA